MGKRCLICLLTENNFFTEDVCEAIGRSIYNNEDIEWPKNFRVEPSPWNGGSVTFGRNHRPQNTVSREEGEREEEREEEEYQNVQKYTDEEEESEKPDEYGESPAGSRKKKRGGFKGRKRLPMQRTALTLQ